jgi:hypothetical protein
MSDMAAASSGHKQTDHLRIVALCEAAAQFAFDVLEDGGTFVAKVLAGGAENEIADAAEARFTKVANVKPPASRADSSEKFVVATTPAPLREGSRRTCIDSRDPLQPLSSRGRLPDARTASLGIRAPHHYRQNATAAEDAMPNGPIPAAAVVALLIPFARVRPMRMPPRSSALSGCPRSST